MSDFDGTLEVFDVGPALMCHELVDLGSACYIGYTGER